MTHTPGPWKVHNHHHADGEQWLSILCGAWDITHNHAKQPGVIADSKYSAMSDAENLANARLIAAAPDLLAALCDMVEAVDPGGAAGVEPFFTPVLHKARAAIAKAKGE